jgi:hypothetical protein
MEATIWHALRLKLTGNPGLSKIQIYDGGVERAGWDTLSSTMIDERTFRRLECGLDKIDGCSTGTSWQSGLDVMDRLQNVMDPGSD